MTMLFKGMVRLVATNPTLIDRTVLKKARQAAFKHDRPAYTLMAKLLPGNTSILLSLVIFAPLFINFVSFL